MLKIRLSRTGKRGHATYRVVVTEHARQTRGKPAEILGSYDPHTDTARLREERVRHWLQQGAKPSPTVHNLLVTKKIIDAPKQAAWKPKKKQSAESEEAKPKEPEAQK